MQHVFSLYDAATQAYGLPMCAVSKGAAVRSLQDAIAGGQAATLSKHPQDFVLYYLGTFNESTALFELLQAPERVIGAHEVVAAS